MIEERDGRKTDEAGDQPKAGSPPPAGPHDRPELTNDDATPGAGALPSRDPASPDDEVDPAAD